MAASIFRSALQTPTQNQSIFGQDQSTRGSVFDRLGPPQPTFNSNQAKSIFAQANQNIYSSTSNNSLSTQRGHSDPKSVFAQASQNVFGWNPPQNVFSNAANSQQNLFANASRPPHNVFANANSSLFGPKVQQSHNPPGNVFKISEKSSIFGMPDNSFEQICDDDKVYSKLEQLSQEELAAFEQEHFELGFVPDVPPPKSLCV